MEKNRTHSPARTRRRRSVAVVLAAAFCLPLGCGSENSSPSRQSTSDPAVLERQVAALTASVKAAQDKIVQLEAENAGLKETDQARFQKAVDLETAGRKVDAARAFADVAAKFPSSPLAAEARRKADALQQEVEALKASAKKAISDLAKKIARAPDATTAEKLLDDLTERYPFEEVALAAAKYREQLKAMAEKEKEAATNASTLGIEISNIRTYWAIDRSTTGNEMAVPFIRLNVKNVSGRPISRLYAKAAFELVDKKERLGEGDTYVIGPRDPPLKAGYSREVFFGSRTGYSGIGIIVNRPRTTADLYMELRHGDAYLVKTIKISTKLE